MALLEEAWQDFQVVRSSEAFSQQPAQYAAPQGSYSAGDSPQGALNANAWQTLTAVPAPLGFPQSAGQSDDAASHSLHAAPAAAAPAPHSTPDVRTATLAQVALLETRVAELEARLAARDTDLVVYIAVGGFVVLLINAFVTRK
jgi:hypothetical protein